MDAHLWRAVLRAGGVPVARVLVRTSRFLLDLVVEEFPGLWYCVVASDKSFVLPSVASIVHSVRVQCHETPLPDLKASTPSLVRLELRCCAPEVLDADNVELPVSLRHLSLIGPWTKALWGGATDVKTLNLVGCHFLSKSILVFPDSVETLNLRVCFGVNGWWVRHWPSGLVSLCITGVNVLVGDLPLQSLEYVHASHCLLKGCLRSKKLRELVMTDCDIKSLVVMTPGSTVVVYRGTAH
jgi:hypothetical protein